MLAVVTVASGRHAHLRAQRRSLARGARRPDLHVVVAIDDPEIGQLVQDGTGLPTTVVPIERVGGRLPLAAARNLGVSAAEAAGAELLVLLDVDCLADEDLLACYERHARDPRLAGELLCGAVTYLPEDADDSSGGLRHRRDPHPARPDPAPGQVLAGDHRLFWSLSFALTRRTWQRVGGFHEAYLGYGAEDTDFAQLARRAGVGLSWVGRADAFHQFHPTASPPVQHLDDILRNGEIFAGRWGWWPMTGWLEQFERLGLVCRVEGQWRPARPRRILSVPSTHPYVEAVRPPGAEAVAGDRIAGWEPDPALTTTGLARLGDAIDVIHLHFGYEHLSVAELGRWLDAVRVRKLPLIVTVHDLRNPHLHSNEHHEEQLRLLLAAAAEVITLTPGAAAEIRRRFGRPARVIAHPSLLDTADPRPATVPGLVVLHLKGLRANVGPLGPLVRAALAGAAEAGGWLRVDLHPEVAAADSVAEIHALAGRGRLELRVHDRFSDEALIDYLSRAQVSVLPYRFGTHSGWLELCRDLGTSVVVPDCGYYAEQWPAAISYRHNETAGLDEESLAAAVAAALRRGESVPADAQARAIERTRIRAEHARVYAEAGR